MHIKYYFVSDHFPFYTLKNNFNWLKIKAKLSKLNCNYEMFPINKNLEPRCAVSEAQSLANERVASAEGTCDAHSS